jgi:hypothetical protein
MMNGECGMGGKGIKMGHGNPVEMLMVNYKW